ncbi:endolytic transglycosylase MltG [Helicobacter suis]|uniref:endolytic transglycosylase MltG n=1 Tax=Helicobacter suis TaxID=104628 RepID=UPI0013D6D14A|nr:endolytic transglycosylase MltG [Helicobacter suis]
MLSLFFYLSIPIKSSSIVYIPNGPLKKAFYHLKNISLEATTPTIPIQVNTLDLWILRLMEGLHIWQKPKSGYIAISIKKHNQIRKGDFLHALSISKPVYRNITLIPGETLYFFIRDLARIFYLKVQDLKQAYNTPYQEAGIIPDTYRFSLGISAQNLMRYLLQHAHTYYQNLSIQLLGRYDVKEWQKTLIIASIIQKEAANASEMPLISGVIANRLKKGMPLQMDGSLNYGKYSHTKVTHARILEDTSDYNTYKHKGLPKVPIGSVGLEAIKAALFPAKTKFLYFVKTREGTHKFSQYYQEHVRSIHSY